MDDFFFFKRDLFNFDFFSAWFSNESHLDPLQQGCFLEALTSKRTIQAVTAWMVPVLFEGFLNLESDPPHDPHPFGKVSRLGRTKAWNQGFQLGVLFESL